MPDSSVSTGHNKIDPWGFKPPTRNTNVDIFDYNAEPYSYLNPETTRFSAVDLLNLTTALSQNPSSAFGQMYQQQIYRPERVLLQEAIATVSTHAQIPNTSDKPYDGNLAASVKNVLNAIPVEQVQAYTQRMDALYDRSYSHLLAAAKEGKTDSLTSTELEAYNQAKNEYQIAGEKQGVRAKLNPGDTPETIIAKRSAGIVYNREARAAGQQLVMGELGHQFEQGMMQPLKTHPRGSQEVGMIAGGPASGKGYNASLLEADMAAGKSDVSDRLYFNTDVYRPLLLGPEHNQPGMELVRGQLTADECRIIRGRVSEYLNSSERLPNLLIDQVFPTPAEVALGTQSDKPFKLVIVATDADKAIIRAFSRGEKEGRFEMTQEVLTRHRNVSNELPKEIIPALMGKNVQLEIYDNNVDGRIPQLIVTGDLKNNHIEVLDPVAAARFFQKGSLNVKAGSSAELYDHAAQPNLDFVSQIAAKNPQVEITVNIPNPGGQIIQLTMKDGKLTCADPVSYKAALEQNPKLAAVMQESHASGLLAPDLLPHWPVAVAGEKTTALPKGGIHANGTPKDMGNNDSPSMQGETFPSKLAVAGSVGANPGASMSTVSQPNGSGSVQQTGRSTIIDTGGPLLNLYPAQVNTGPTVKLTPGTGVAGQIIPDVSTQQPPAMQIAGNATVENNTHAVAGRIGPNGVEWVAGQPASAQNLAGTNAIPPAPTVSSDLHNYIDAASGNLPQSTITVPGVNAPLTQTTKPGTAAPATPAVGTSGTETRNTSMAPQNRPGFEMKAEQQTGLSTALALKATGEYVINFNKMTTGEKIGGAATQVVFDSAATVDIGKWITGNQKFGGMIGETATHSAGILGFALSGKEAYNDTSDLIHNAGNGDLSGTAASAAKLEQSSTMLLATGGTVLKFAAEKGVPLAARTLTLIGGEGGTTMLISGAASKAALPLTVAQLAFSAATAVTLDRHTANQEEINSLVAQGDAEDAKYFRQGFTGPYKFTQDISASLPIKPEQAEYLQLSRLSRQRYRRDADGHYVTIDLETDPNGAKQTLDKYAQQAGSSLSERQSAAENQNSWSRTSLTGAFVNIITPGDWDKDDQTKYDHANEQHKVAMQALNAKSELNDFTKRMDVYQVAAKALNPEHPEQASETYKRQFAAVKDIQMFYYNMRTNAEPDQIRNALGFEHSYSATATRQAAEFGALMKAAEESPEKARADKERELGLAKARTELAEAQKHSGQLYADYRNKNRRGGFSTSAEGRALFNSCTSSASAVNSLKENVEKIETSITQAEVEQKQKGQLAIRQYYATQLAAANAQKEYVEVMGMTTEQQATYFQNNALFINKTGLKSREDLALVSLSTSMDELIAKRLDDPDFIKQIDDMRKQNQKIIDLLKADSLQNIVVPVGGPEFVEMNKALQESEKAEGALKASRDKLEALAKSLHDKTANGKLSADEITAQKQAIQDTLQKQQSLIAKQHFATIKSNAVLVKAEQASILEHEKLLAQKPAPQAAAQNPSDTKKRGGNNLTSMDVILGGAATKETADEKSKPVMVDQQSAAKEILGPVYNKLAINIAASPDSKSVTTTLAEFRESLAKADEDLRHNNPTMDTLDISTAVKPSILPQAREV